MASRQLDGDQRRHHDTEDDAMKHQAHDETANAKFNFTFDCSLAQVGGHSSSFIEPDSSAMSASSIEEASSTSSNINWSVDRNDSASLSDSVQTFPKEFGRTYHAYRAGSYAFPNDTPEQERMELQGECIKMLMGGSFFFAPISHLRPPRAILDLATGTGDWAINMGDLFPEALVIGTDLSPIQPAQVPPNVHFYVEDSSDPWDFASQFDFIHTRATSGSWANFEKDVVEQAFNALEPGGWLESQEVDCNVYSDDHTLDPDGPVATWSRDLIEASARLGRPAIVGAHLKDMFERVGFVDVQQHRFKMPINGWPKDPLLKQIGYMWGTNLMEGLAAFSLQLFNKALERTSAQIEVSLIDVRRDLTNPRIHCYMPAFVVFGRKPHAHEVRA